MSPIGKPTLSWQDRAIQVAKYHKSCWDEHYDQKSKTSSWRLEDTAKELNRSAGRISEDLMLAEWMAKDPRVSRCSTAKEALEYIRRIKRDIHLSRFDGLDKRV